MNTYRKPLFWGMVLLLAILMGCAACLGGYIVFGQPLITSPDQHGLITYTQFTDEPGLNNMQSTIVALKYEQKKYFDQRDTDKTIAISERVIALDPDNPTEYFDNAYIYRHLAERKTSLGDYMDLLKKSLAYADKGISLAPKNGDLYLQRSYTLITLSNGYAYRADRDYLNRQALEDMKKGIALGNSIPVAEKNLVADNVELQDCDSAMSEAIRQATAEPAGSKDEPSGATMLEGVYLCKGDYQKALEYHMANLKKFNRTDKDCGCEGVTAMYLYQLGKTDDAYNMVNQALIEKPNYVGSRYFIRAAIEFDRGEYDKALEDAEYAEGSSWAFGTFRNYIEGLNAERLGHTQEAITKLQYVEATMNENYNFATRRAHAELEKLGAVPLVVTPSVHLSTTPEPPASSPDLNTVPTYSPNVPAQ